VLQSNFYEILLYYFHLVRMEKNTSTNHKREEEEIGSKVKKTKTKEETNILVVREALEAINSGDLSRVHEFISPQYFNHES
jgi:hypothetical protein